jgi:nucleotide-binding universal stress UspA family protein
MKEPSLPCARGVAKGGAALARDSVVEDDMTLSYLAEPHLETTPIAIGSIVVATDFSSVSQRAFEVAAQVARNYGSRLVLVHVISPVSAPPLTGAESRQFEMDSWHARQKLTELAADPSVRGLDVRTTLALGAVGEEVMDVVDNQKGDLLVVGTHGGHGLEKLLIGSMAEALFRGSSVPVITVGPHSGRIRVPFKKILFATDLSGRDLRAAQYATSIAKENDAEVTFLHVLDHENGDRHEAWNEAAARLRELAPFDAEEFCQPLFLVDSGDPAVEILRNAKEERADLIVLPVSSPLMSDHPTWSIASKVVRESACPVLTVRDRL